jgi:NADPH2:quinone reductase
MRAIVFEELGGPDVLKLVEVPDPEPGPGEVTVDVAYAGVNFGDVKARAGGYRLGGLPFRPAAEVSGLICPGVEVSGLVRAVGEGVTAFVPGQAVAAFTSRGGYAEIAVAPAVSVFALPSCLSLRTAAALPNVLPTAYALLHEVGRLRDGDTVLVQGAAGGVGTLAGQLARMGGASAVYGVVSSLDKAEHAMKSGYDQVFVTATFDDEARAMTGGRGVDIALDPVGGETFRRTLAVVARFGRMVSFGNTSGGGSWHVGPGELYPLGISVAGFSILAMVAKEPARLREIADRAFAAVVEGGIELPISAEFALEDAPDAHRLLESRTSTGKLLLRVSE